MDQRVDTAAIGILAKVDASKNQLGRSRSRDHSLTSPEDGSIFLLSSLRCRSRSPPAFGMILKSYPDTCEC